MKNASQIINSIQSKPQFSKLNRYKCIKKVQSAFIPALQKMVKFAYFKNNTLFFVLNHPAGKQEFDNNIQNIKSALNFLKPVECEGILIDDIKAFVTHSPKKEKVKFKITKQIYTERASGEIEVKIKDTNLNRLVKSIQEIIKAKKNSK
ncbi:MAG: hypothetical protein U9P72_03155 [Campylobacterota bacterium]|nr:hypothetical protein [Campylobacterota bacterium]